ncbi:MAG TPA: hypothetical protein VFI91_02595 [Longimicrobiaceae bacterium]|nr:hypothetical protein [Longimicrobiaceae bacterium]
MNERYTDLNGGFAVTIPAGWLAEADVEEGGVLMAREDGSGLLHLISFDREPGEIADPAEELYSFLEEMGIELQEDEVEDLEIGGATEVSLCEYITEDGDGDEKGDPDGPTFWLTAVATAPGRLVFGSYSTPAGEESLERETIIAILKSLTFEEAA